AYCPVVGIDDEIYLYGFCFIGQKFHLPYFPIIAKAVYFSIFAILLFYQWQPTFIGFYFELIELVYLHLVQIHTASRINTVYRVAHFKIELFGSGVFK